MNFSKSIPNGFYSLYYGMFVCQQGVQNVMLYSEFNSFYFEKSEKLILKKK